MRPFLALGLTVLVVFAAVVFGGGGILAVLMLGYVAMGYVLWDERRSTRAIRASVSEAAARRDRALAKD